MARHFLKLQYAGCFLAMGEQQGMSGLLWALSWVPLISTGIKRLSAPHPPGRRRHDGVSHSST